MSSRPLPYFASLQAMAVYGVTEETSCLAMVGCGPCAASRAAREQSARQKAGIVMQQPQMMMMAQPQMQQPQPMTMAQPQIVMQQQPIQTQQQMAPQQMKAQPVQMTSI